MKKTLIFGAATAAVALTLGSCAVSGCSNDAVTTLYGPPPQDDPQGNNQGVDNGDIEIDDPIEDVYGPPVDYDEDDENIIVALYGPPADIDVGEDTAFADDDK